MRPLEAQCHCVQGELARGAGEQKGENERFGTAAAMFREMGMQSWLEKAQTSLCLSRGDPS
jgi:hypothetical protein